MALGIFDWGTGGLGLQKALREIRPDLDMVYVGDVGTEAYSLLSREALAERVEQILQAFAQMGISRVLLAGHSASTAIADVSVPGVEISGVIEPTLQTMRTKQFKEVGVIGGRRAILSGAYGRSLRKQRFMVVQRVSLDLADVIESGNSQTEELEDLVRALLEPLAKSDGLLLANTHYSLISPIIQSVLPKAEIIDPTRDTAISVASQLPIFQNASGKSSFYTTGEASDMKRKARALYGLSADFHHLALNAPGMAA